MFGVLLATMMIPVEVTIIPEYLMMLNLGWYNTYYPLIVPSMLVGSFGTFLFRGFFENIPSSIEEAAIIDGANAWQMFSRVFFPNAKPVSASLIIIAFMNNWNDLLRPVIYLESERLYTATMGLMQFRGLRRPVALALGGLHRVGHSPDRSLYRPPEVLCLWNADFRNEGIGFADISCPFRI